VLFVQKTESVRRPYYTTQRRVSSNLDFGSQLAYRLSGARSVQQGSDRTDRKRTTDSSQKEAARTNEPMKGSGNKRTEKR
jgi:hypothetical protein